MIYDFIYDHQSDFSIRKLCAVLKVSKSSYYSYQKGDSYVQSIEDKKLEEAVKRVFDLHKRRYGGLRIWEELKFEGYKISLYKVRKLMKTQSLRAIQPKSYVPVTTQTHPHLRRSPNLLLNYERISYPNQVIVGDITYLPNERAGEKKWLFLATWLDLFSRKIVGWKVDDNMQEQLVIKALKQVIRNRVPRKGLIVHSDGGSQYSSINFRTLLKTHGFQQSMSRRENHYDNAFAESLFSRLKAELLDGSVFYGIEDARIKTFEYIEAYYNTIRRHSSIEYLSPNQFEQKFFTEKAL